MHFCENLRKRNLLLESNQLSQFQILMINLLSKYPFSTLRNSINGRNYLQQVVVTNKNGISEVTVVITSLYSYYCNTIPINCNAQLIQMLIFFIVNFAQFTIWTVSTHMIIWVYFWWYVILNTFFYPLCFIQKSFSHSVSNFKNKCFLI